MDAPGTAEADGGTFGGRGGPDTTDAGGVSALMGGGKKAGGTITIPSAIPQERIPRTDPERRADEGIFMASGKG